ncbi:hypothetical protein GQ55_3G320300 [Panicum hallii var. hallii]|uniref:Uncharacterized protein n=1 Tax=Panicum hallii var. hallii TaxID=1504633 RepID=A0A2T7EFC4_9POAL|nr:hypothetical protein GQ55_3G320300 [Panicum hallii var. hallii]
MAAATLGSQFNLPPLPSPPPPPPTFVPYVRVPSPQVGSTSTHPRGVSASPSTPPSTARNIFGGDCADENSTHNFVGLRPMKISDIFSSAQKADENRRIFSSATVADENSFIFVGSRRKRAYFRRVYFVGLFSSGRRKYAVFL